MRRDETTEMADETTKTVGETPCRTCNGEGWTTTYDKQGFPDTTMCFYCDGTGHVLPDDYFLTDEEWRKYADMDHPFQQRM